MVYPLGLKVLLTEEVEREVGVEEGEEEGEVEEGVVNMERPSTPRCASVPLCHHQ